MAQYVKLVFSTNTCRELFFIIANMKVLRVINEKNSNVKTKIKNHSFQFSLDDEKKNSSRKKCTADLIEFFFHTFSHSHTHFECSSKYYKHCQ